MTTPEALDRLKSRHPMAKGKWAWIVEFMNIDFVAVGCWTSLEFAVHGYEVKVSRSDWLRELKSPDKAELGMSRCDFWYLAAPPGILKDGELPAGWGYVELGARGSRVMERPKRLRPKPDRAVHLSNHGALLFDPSFIERQTFAGLARRFAYELADREELAAEVSEDLTVMALDRAARRTGRLDSKSKELNRDFARYEKEERRKTRQHHDHIEAGHPYSAECSYGWCAQAAKSAPGLLG